MQQRVALLLILAGAVLLLAACGSQAIPPTAAVQTAATPGLQFRMVQVKTSTPVGGGPAATPTRPAATVLPTSRPTAIVAASRPPATGTVPPALRTATPDPKATVERIEVADAKARLDAGTAVLVDVRSAASYVRGHALGALSIPETEMPERYTELPKDKLIVLYCT